MITSAYFDWVRSSSSSIGGLVMPSAVVTDSDTAVLTQPSGGSSTGYPVSESTKFATDRPAANGRPRPHPSIPPSQPPAPLARLRRTSRTESEVRIGIIRESKPGETRVAATPKTVEQLCGLGYEVVVETGAGAEASFTD